MIGHRAPERFGPAYEEYRRSVPMLVPFTGRRVTGPGRETVEAMAKESNA